MWLASAVAALSLTLLHCASTITWAWTWNPVAEPLVLSLRSYVFGTMQPIAKFQSPTGQDLLHCASQLRVVRYPALAYISHDSTPLETRGARKLRLLNPDSCWCLVSSRLGQPTGEHLAPPQLSTSTISATCRNASSQTIRPLDRAHSAAHHSTGREGEMYLYSCGDAPKESGRRLSSCLLSLGCTVPTTQ